MSIRPIAASSLALAAALLAQPALAQRMPYTGYDDAGDAPVQVPVEPSEYYSEPVVQPVETDLEYRTGYEAYRQEPVIAVEPPMAPDAPSPIAYDTPYDSAYDAAYAEDAYYPEAYDQEPPIAPDVALSRYGDPTWQARCVDAQRAARERGQVAGAIIGGAAGAVVGNRVAGRGDRLAGTLIGGGVGALGGAAVGSAVAGDRPVDCEVPISDGYAYGEPYDRGYGDQYHGHDTLPPPPRPRDRHYAYRVIQAPPPPPPHVAHGSYRGYPDGGYGYGATTVIIEEEHEELVPVVREYVTEEWVEVEQPRTVVRKRVIQRPAATKRIKYIRRSK